MSLAWVCRWLYTFLVFSVCLCPLSTCSSTSGLTPLLFKWRYQNENLLGSTLLYVNTRQILHIYFKLSGVSLRKVIVHWYQPKEGEPLKWILYGSTKITCVTSAIPAWIQIRKSMMIDNVLKSDETTCYCACWYLTMSQSQKAPIRKPSLWLTLDSFLTWQPQQTLSCSSSRVHKLLEQERPFRHT